MMRDPRLARCLLAAVLASLALGCRVEVLHDLPEGEANQILAVLQANGIAADKGLADAEQNTWTVSVSEPDTGRAWAVLQEYKLPRKRERRFRDVFGKSKLVVTPMEERALFLEALQGELAQTLESINGIIDARVHLVLPVKDLAGQSREPAKASVVLEYQPTSHGELPIQKAEVQQMVAHAVEGLRPEAVVTVLKPSSITTPKSSVETGADLVSSAGLVLERGSVERFKLYVVVAILALAGLGLMVFVEGRMNSQLRWRLEAAERQLKARRKAGVRLPQRAVS